MILINNCKINPEHFPDNTLRVKFPDHIIPNLYEKSNTIHWYYENDSELFTLIVIKGALDDLGVINTALYMPYIPHARMDRIKNDAEIFTLKYFCKIINYLNFSYVTVLDPHSNVSTALIDRLNVISAKDHIQNAIRKINDKSLVLFYPDEGAMKRYSDQNNLPYAFGIKKRDWNTGNILGLQLMNDSIIQGNNVLIIDDICSRGGTFYHAANALKEAGANDIYLYITHAEYTMIEGDMYNQDIVRKIFTTNSIFKTKWDKRGKVDIV